MQSHDTDRFDLERLADDGCPNTGDDSEGYGMA
jgi:hypothetical protein